MVTGHNPCPCVAQIWPEEMFPLRTVGRLVLDQNIDNFHNESEQIAFSPGLSPPGRSPARLRRPVTI